MNTAEVIKVLQDQRDSILQKLHSLEQTIELLRQMPMNGKEGANSDNQRYNEGSFNNPVVAFGKYTEYDPSSSLKNRMLAIIKAENRFLHNREIAGIAHSLEPEAGDLETWVGRVSATLSSLKKSNPNLVNIKIGTSSLNYFWGSKSWLDDKGEIKPAHLYDKNQLAYSKEEVAI